MLDQPRFLASLIWPKARSHVLYNTQSDVGRRELVMGVDIEEQQRQLETAISASVSNCRCCSNLNRLSAMTKQPLCVDSM